MDGIKSIGIIIDGNRRWAKERGMKPWDGHREGVLRLTDTIRWAKEAGIQHIFFYTFSTENWDRDPEEIKYLFMLFEEFFNKEIRKVEDEKIRIRIAGQRERFPANLQKFMLDAEERTAGFADMTVWFGLSYGGRAEILAAANAAAAAGVEMTQENFKQYMWTADMPDPEIILRTGGEQRLSGFLTWQSVYSEMFFSKTPWPGFTKEEFMGLLEEFSTRKRRMGK